MTFIDIAEKYKQALINAGYATVELDPEVGYEKLMFNKPIRETDVDDEYVMNVAIDYYTDEMFFFKLSTSATETGLKMIGMVDNGKFERATREEADRLITQTLEACKYVINMYNSATEAKLLKEINAL